MMMRNIITNNDLYDFLVKKFAEVDSRFIGVENRFMDMEDRLDKIDTTQDYILRELKDLKEEKIVGAYRSQRMESWITKAAKKIKVPYNP